jgi:hypothetical protein
MVSTYKVIIKVMKNKLSHVFIPRAKDRGRGFGSGMRGMNKRGGGRGGGQVE